MMMTMTMMQKEKRKKRKDSEEESKSHRNSSSEEYSQEVPNLLSVLRTHFIDEFVIFTSLFLDHFVRCADNGGRVDKKRKENARKCTEQLTDFGRELYNNYFDLVQKELLSEARNIARGKKPTIGISNLIKLLKQFYHDLIQPIKLIPEAKLGDKASGIIENAIRECVTSVFNLTQSRIVEILKDTYTRVKESTSITTQASSSEEIKKQKLITIDTNEAKKIAKCVTIEIENSLQLLVPILSHEKYLPGVKDLGCKDLAHSHLQDLLNSLNTIVMCGVVRDTEGPVLDPPDPSPLTQAVPEIQTMAPPLFFLILSQTCSQMKSTYIDRTLKSLKNSFPKNSNQSHGSFEHEVPTILSRIQESADLLLQRYIVIYGYRIDSAVYRTKQKLSVADGKKNTFLTSVAQEISAAQRELNIMFPQTASRPNPEKAERLARLRRANARENSLNTTAGISRLFIEKVRIFGPAKYNSISPLIGILKILFKAMVEVIRVRSLNVEEWEQLQFQVYALREFTLEMIPASGYKELESLLTEISHSGAKRCRHTPDVVEAVQLDD